MRRWRKVLGGAALVGGSLYAGSCASDKFHQTLSIGFTGACVNIFMRVLNKTTKYDEIKLIDAVYNRPSTTPLITVSNHASTFDDPFLIGVTMPFTRILQVDKMRWGFCAADVCFQDKTSFHRFMSAYFRSGKVLPMIRGGGLRQQAILDAEDKLKNGDWVHLFPEGRVSPDNSILVIRRGIGAFVASCGNAPLLIPIYHRGMADIQPYSKGLFTRPRVGKHVRVRIGDPIDVSDLHAKLRSISSNSKTNSNNNGDIDKEVIQLYEEVASRVWHALNKMRIEMDNTIAEEENLDIHP